MANKQLTASVRLNTTQFEQKLKRIARGIDALNNAVGTQSSAYRAVNAALAKTDKLTKDVKKSTDSTAKSTSKWVSSLNAATSKLAKCKSLVGSLSSRMGRLASTLLGVGSITLAVQGADTLTGAENRFNNIAAQQLGSSAYTTDSVGTVTGYSDKALSFTQDTMDKIYTSAQKTRTLYSDMLSNVSKTMTLAPDAFQGNIDNAIRFQEIMSEAYAVGGASAQEMSTSMYQLTQALGAGTLAGDELRSVREGAPLAYQKIEEFAQGVYNTEESLKDLASQGKITSDLVVAAVMNMGDEMDQAFALTKYRFTDVWSQIKSSAQKAFEPVVKMLTEKLNEAVDNGLIQKFEKFFTIVANLAMTAFTAIEGFIVRVAENWDWLKHVIMIGLIAITTYEIARLAVIIALWIKKNRLMLQAVAVFVIIIAAIYLTAQTWISFANGVITLGEAIIQTLLIIAIALLLIGIITGSIPLLIAAVIVAVIAIVVYFFEYIAGGVAWLGATIWNIIVGVVNAVIQFLWTRFVEPWIGIIEWVLNVFNGGFNSFGDGVKNLLGNIISWFLSLGKVVTKIIDAIFGTNWTDGLNSLQDKVLSWGKNENSITLSREAPEVLKRIDATDAYNSGAAWGADLMNYKNQASEEKEKTSLLDQMSNKLGISGGLGSSGNGTGLNYDNADDLLKNISGNTDSMADSMDLTQEDLEYLRRVANMEWKKEFTTANITVDMSNYNTINGDSDLDGIVTKLSDKLYEEMNAVANGVYA